VSYKVYEVLRINNRFIIPGTDKRHSFLLRSILALSGRNPASYKMDSREVLFPGVKRPEH
jgi:hypothetical protein